MQRKRLESSQEVPETGPTSSPDSFESWLLELADTPCAPLALGRAPLGVGSALAGGRFRLGRRLGAGGMGVVYEAFDAERQQRVALKLLQRLDPAAIYRFKNEFRALSDIVDPNLVRLHELFVEEERWFFTMERVEGVNFLEYVRPAGALDLTRLRAACAQLAHGIRTIHGAGKLHRDLKPSNVLVGRQGRVVVLDFGLVIDAAPGGVGRTVDDEAGCGTPAYMAPEQSIDGAATAQSDWYGFGVMLYEALTGAPPFTGTAAEILRAKRSRAPESPRARNPNAPPDLSALCLQLLAEAASRAGYEAVARTLPMTAAATAIEPPPSSGPALVGRGPERERLERAYRWSKSGAAPVLAVLAGDSGMGKSALAEEFLRELRRTGEALVLEGRCYEREAVPFKAFDGVIDALSRHLRALPEVEAAALMPREAYALSRIFPVLNRVGVIATAPARDVKDAQELRQRAFRGFGELIGRARDRRPVVLYIDDLQWCDHDSVAMLSALTAAKEPPPVLLIVAYRREEAGAALVREFRRAVEANPRFETCLIEIDRLSEAESAVLARRLIPDRGEDPAELCSWIAREAEGSPFFVIELARRLPAERATGRIGLTEALLEHVGQLPRHAQDLLQLIALAAAPVNRRVLRAAAAADDIESALAVLGAHQLIRTTDVPGCMVTYHDRIREAVVTSLGPERAAALHDALARALRAEPEPDPELVAQHLAGAGRPAEAAGFALQAAERAAAALAFDRAAQLYDQALRDGEHAPERRRELLVARGSARENAGRGVEAADDYLAALDGAPESEAFDLRVRAAGALMLNGCLERGLSVLSPSLSAYDMEPARSDSAAMAQILARDLILRVRGPRRRARRSARLDPRVQRRIQLGWACVRGYTMADQLRALEYAYRTALLALDAGESRLFAMAYCFLGTYLTNFGELERGARMIAHARRLVTARGGPYEHAFVDVVEGSARFFAADYPGCLALLARGVQVLREQCVGVHWEVATAENFAAWALFWSGRFDELARRIPDAAREAERLGNLYGTITLSIGPHAVAWLVHDDTEIVERAHHRARQRWQTPREDLQSILIYVGETLLAFYRDADVARFAQLWEAWPAIRAAPVMRSHTLQSLVHHAHVGTAVALARHRPDQRAALLAQAERSVRCLERIPNPAARCTVRFSRAALACARGDTARAVLELEAAREIARRQHMAMYRAAATRRLGALLGGAGASLVDEADAAMRAQAIVRPDRMTALLAPGCEL